MMAAGNLASTGMNSKHPSDTSWYAAISDLPSDRDTLGMQPVVQAAAAFLLHPDTKATTFAVCGPWGKGKSTCMKLLEEQMLREAAAQAAKESGILGSCFGRRSQVPRLSELTSSPEVSPSKHAALKEALRTIAQPRLITAWFNAWQYVKEEQIWAGVVVELVKAVEAVLPLSMRWSLAWEYNLRARKSKVLLQLVLPLLLALALVGGLTAFGIWQLMACLSCNKLAYTCLKMMASGDLPSVGNTSSPAANTTLNSGIINSSLQTATSTTSQLPGSGTVTTIAVPLRVAGSANLTSIATIFTPAKEVVCRERMAKWLSALVGVLGCLLLLLVVWKRVNEVIKPLSESLEKKLQYINLPDHGDKVGYQNEVIKDIHHMQAVLQSQNGFCSGPLSLVSGFWHCIMACLQCFCCSRGALLPCCMPAAAVAASGTPRLVVFVDDLDRVPPLKVVDVLEAINLILSASGITTMIGMDKNIVRAALKAYSKDNKALEASADVFMEKIVHVAVNLPTDWDTQSYLESIGVCLPTSKPTTKSPTRKLMGSFVGHMWYTAVSYAVYIPYARFYVWLAVQAWRKQHVCNIVMGPRFQSQERLRASASRQPYTASEVSMLRALLSQASLPSLTPRKVKLFLNQLHLAKCIVQTLIRQRRQQQVHKLQQVIRDQERKHEPWVTKRSCWLRGELDEVEQLVQRAGPAADVQTYQQLLSYMFLWSKHPEGMAALLNYLKLSNAAAGQQQPHSDQRSAQLAVAGGMGALTQLLQTQAEAYNSITQLESTVSQLEKDLQAAQQQVTSHLTAPKWDQSSWDTEAATAATKCQEYLKTFQAQQQLLQQYQSQLDAEKQQFSDRAARIQAALLAAREQHTPSFANAKGSGGGDGSGSGGRAHGDNSSGGGDNGGSDGNSGDDISRQQGDAAAAGDLPVTGSSAASAAATSTDNLPDGSNGSSSSNATGSSQGIGGSNPSSSSEACSGTPQHTSADAALQAEAAAPPAEGVVNCSSLAPEALEALRRIVATRDNLQVISRSMGACRFQPRGLNNTGNLCYMNSTLQALLAVSPFCSLLQQLAIAAPALNAKQAPILAALAKFGCEFKPLAVLTVSSETPTAAAQAMAPSIDAVLGKALTPTMLDAIVARFKTWRARFAADTVNMKQVEQEDAPEFLQFLLEEAHGELIKLRKDLPAAADLAASGSADVSSSSRIATDKLQQQTDSGDDDDTESASLLSSVFHCVKEERRASAGESPTGQPFWLLPLAIQPDDVTSITKALDKTCATETTGGVEKSNKILKMPQVLLLHLQRSSSNAGNASKLDKVVEFPVQLELDSQWLSDCCPGRANRNYKLIATVTHDGKDTSAGHYTANVLQDGRWMHFDDAMVSFYNESAVLLERPYLLVYQMV